MYEFSVPPSSGFGNIRMVLTTVVMKSAVSCSVDLKSASALALLNASGFMKDCVIWAKKSSDTGIFCSSDRGPFRYCARSTMSGSRETG